MCGIVGIVNKNVNRPCDISSLISMRDLLFYRGPDDKGLHVDGNIGLGHRRLSIIDLNSGHQPMTNEDDSLWIVYNGEIYNFKSLREDLVKRGHIFRTKTDTEVILHLYEEKGNDCVKDLNGMFAFAIWDERNRTLLLARDRMGIKPLYYVQTENAFLFASEIKSLFESRELQAECNDEAILEYLVFRDVAGEGTLFKNVRRLLPGHTLRLLDDRIQIQQYWTVFPLDIRNDIKFDQAVEELTFLIEDAVKIRMMSDVPLGTFCSGGIDSSLVTAIAAQFVNSPINTFSVGFHEKKFDESSYAQLVSGQYATTHHELKLDNEEFANLLPQAIWHNDEPLHFENSVQIYSLSKLTKKNVTVVLTGEGADELFAGYPRFQIPGLLARYQQMPAVLRNFIWKASTLFKDHRVEKMKNNLKYTSYDSLLYNAGLFDKEFLFSVFTNNHGRIEFPYREGVLNEVISRNSDIVSKVCLLDQHMYLVSLLNRQDKMSMAASVESRVPFLDYRIVEFSNSLPVEFKVKRFKGKHILRKMARKYLPKQVINRKKSGFGVPVGQWMRENQGLGGLVKNITAESGFPDYLDKRRLADIVAEHKSGAKDHSEFLWTAINLKIWKNLFNT